MSMDFVKLKIKSLTKSLSHMLYGGVDKTRWQTRNDCAHCHYKFGFFSSKLNCTRCGDMFCKDCCSSKVALTRDPNNPFKVCTDCFRLVSELKRIEFEEQNFISDTTSLQTLDRVSATRVQENVVTGAAVGSETTGEAPRDQSPAIEPNNRGQHEQHPPTKEPEDLDADDYFGSESSSPPEFETEQLDTERQMEVPEAQVLRHTQKLSPPPPPTYNSATSANPTVNPQPPNYHHAPSPVHQRPNTEQGPMPIHQPIPSPVYQQAPVPTYPQHPPAYHDPHQIQQHLAPNLLIPQQASAYSQPQHVHQNSEAYQYQGPPKPPPPPLDVYQDPAQQAVHRLPLAQVIHAPRSNQSNKKQPLTPRTGKATPTFTNSLPVESNGTDHSAATSANKVKKFTTGNMFLIALDEVKRTGSTSKVLLVTPTVRAAKHCEMNLRLRKELVPTAVTQHFNLNDMHVGSKASICCTSALDFALTIIRGADSGNSPFSHFDSVVICVGDHNISLESQLVMWLVRDVAQGRHQIPPVVLCSEVKDLLEVARVYFVEDRASYNVDQQSKKLLNEKLRKSALPLLSLLCLPNGKDWWDAATLISEDRPRIADTAIVSLGLASADGAPTALGQLVAPLAVALECSLEAGCAAAMLAALGYPLVGAVIGINYKAPPAQIVPGASSYIKQIQEKGEEQQAFKRVLKAMHTLKILTNVPTNFQVTVASQFKSANVLSLVSAVLSCMLTDGNPQTYTIVAGCFMPILRCEITESQLVTLVAPGLWAIQLENLENEYLGPLISARFHVNYCLNALLTGDGRATPDFLEQARQRVSVVSAFPMGVAKPLPVIPSLEGFEDADIIVGECASLTALCVDNMFNCYANVSCGKAPNTPISKKA